MGKRLDQLTAACRRAMDTARSSVTLAFEASVFTEDSMTAAGRRAGITEPVTPVITKEERDRRDRQILEIDAALHAFTETMRGKMLRNLHKQDWQTAPFELLWGRAMLEIEELKLAVEYETTDDARKECADVANFMMILFVRIARDGTRREQIERAKQS